MAVVVMAVMVGDDMEVVVEVMEVVVLDSDGGVNSHHNHTIYSIESCTHLKESCKSVT